MDLWLQKISDFFINLVTEFFTALLDFVKDYFFWLVDGFLNAVATLISFIPAPCCVAYNTLGDILGLLSPFALFVINHLDFGVAFGIIACGVEFYLLRKLFTLGQW